MEFSRIMGAMEAVLFASGEPITVEKLAEALTIEKSQVRTALEEMEKAYNEDEKRGLMLRYVDGGVQLVTKPEYYEATARMEKHREIKLSNAAMETLAIIAFKQPVTRADMEQIRGVKVDGVVNTLLDLGLIDEAGHKKAVGNPLLYKTTDKFLVTFGLNSLADLPNPEDPEVMLDALGEVQLTLPMDGSNTAEQPANSLLNVVKETVQEVIKPDEEVKKQEPEELSAVEQQEEQQDE